MSEFKPLTKAFSSHANFSIQEVVDRAVALAVPLPPNLGPLELCASSSAKRVIGTRAQ